MDIHSELSFVPKVLDEYLEGIEPLSPVQLATLHPHSRRREEKRLAAIEKRKHRKKYTRKPGTVHPKKKASTRRRRHERRWRENPMFCVCYGYGHHAIDKGLWNQYLQPYWEMYDPEQLKVKKYKRNLQGVLYGTKEAPYTVYSLTLIHKKLGVLYEGHDQLLYDLSRP